MFKIYGKEISILSNIFIRDGCRKEKLGGKKKEKNCMENERKKITVEN